MDIGMRLSKEDFELAGRKAVKMDIRPCGRDRRKASYEVMNGVSGKCPLDTAIVLEEFGGGRKGNISWRRGLGVGCWDTGKEEVCGGGNQRGGYLHERIVKGGSGVIGSNGDDTPEKNAPCIHTGVKEKSGQPCLGFAIDDSPIDGSGATVVR
jgi:hypothetical protein